MDRPLEEEWRDYELYEKVRVRENRKRIILITLTALIFFGLCSVPVIEERSLKWSSLEAAQVILTEIEKVKTLAIHKKTAVKLHFFADDRFEIDFVKDCKSEKPLERLREGRWPYKEGTLKVLSQSESQGLSLKLATDEICFDPVYGLDDVKTHKVLVIVPVKDLASQRLDRASYVILEGESAKISIN